MKLLRKAPNFEGSSRFGDTLHRKVLDITTETIGVSQFATFLRPPKSFFYQKIKFLSFFQSIGILFSGKRTRRWDFLTEKLLLFNSKNTIVAFFFGLSLFEFQLQKLKSKFLKIVQLIFIQTSTIK
jgi:hypothetical protein